MLTHVLVETWLNLNHSVKRNRQAGRHHHMNLNGIDAGFEAGQLTLSARLGGGGGGGGGDKGYHV
jgi:hypothetical protein